jgi:hypothetical protein
LDAGVGEQVDALLVHVWSHARVALQTSQSLNTTGGGGAS